MEKTVVAGTETFKSKYCYAMDGFQEYVSRYRMRKRTRGENESDIEYLIFNYFLSIYTHML